MSAGAGLKRRWLSALLGMLLLLALLAAHAANTSWPTGRGAVHDHSVYRQNWPGRPSRDPYRGTEPQNPFGGDCRPGPGSEPPRETPPDACPMRRATAPAGVLPVASVTEIAQGLWVAGRQLGGPRGGTIRSIARALLPLSALSARLSRDSRGACRAR